MDRCGTLHGSCEHVGRKGLEVGRTRDSRRHEMGIWSFSFSGSTYVCVDRGFEGDAHIYTYIHVHAAAQVDYASAYLAAKQSLTAVENHCC
jgi:hypothetical protein